MICSHRRQIQGKVDPPKRPAPIYITQKDHQKHLSIRDQRLAYPYNISHKKFYSLSRQVSCQELLPCTRSPIFTRDNGSFEEQKPIKILFLASLCRTHSRYCPSTMIL